MLEARREQLNDEGTDALLEQEAELFVLQTDSDDRRALRKLNSVCCKQTQMTDAP